MLPRLYFVKLLMFLFIGVSVCYVSYGQTEIKGKIIDAKTKLVLPYANIQFKGGLRKGGQTDANGTFDLDVPENVDSVRFSYTGYYSKTLAIRKNEIQEMLIELTVKNIPPIY